MRTIVLIRFLSVVYQRVEKILRMEELCDVCTGLHKALLVTEIMYFVTVLVKKHVTLIHIQMCILKVTKCILRHHSIPKISFHLTFLKIFA